MRCLVGEQCGSYLISTKYIYVAFIRSRIDYGSTDYGSAEKSAHEVAGYDPGTST